MNLEILTAACRNPEGSVKEYFAAAELILRKKGILQKADA